MMLVLETMMIGVFAATDVFLFYVFFEAMLVPMYFMIGSFGVGQRQYAAVKFLLYSLLGGLLMLVAVIALYVYSTHGGHQGTFLFTSLTHLALSSTVQKWLFLGFFIAFAIKAPLWPFHTWLPDAATSAQPGAAVLLVGVLDKVGTFGMIRYCLDLFPSASHYFAGLVITLSVIGVLYGAVVAIGQADMKRLIAYTSVSHMGLITLGIFAMTSQGQSGATLYMVNHGFATGALFILAGFLVSRRGSHLISDYGGVQKVAPVLAGLFLIAGLAGPVAAGPEHVRQRVPGAGRHLHQVRGGRDPGHARHHPGRDLHPVDVPADDDRPGPARGREHARPEAARAVGRRAADRADHRARRLPQAGPRHHQPGRAQHAGRDAQHRPGAAASGPAGQPGEHDQPPHHGCIRPGPRPRPQARAGGPACRTPSSEVRTEARELGVTRIVAAAAPTIAAPHIEWSLLSPMLLVFAAALAGVLIEAFASRGPAAAACRSR